MKLVDIAVNLTDPMFNGVYRGKSIHPPDIQQVVKRARSVGIEQMIITGTTLEESRKALQLAVELDEFSTAGCHPTHALEITDQQSYFRSLKELIAQNRRIVAIGETGLDGDRTNFCPMEVQKQHFQPHFQLARDTQLPMLFHSRNAAKDFYDMVKQNRSLFTTGVVHSFDGTLEEANALVGLGLYIGINGCSLKKQEQLKVVQQLPLDRLMIETDAPWCDIRQSHASYQHINSNALEWPEAKKEKFDPSHRVKSRNEPCSLIHILSVISAIKGMDQEEVAKQVYDNTHRVFQLTP